MGSVKRIVSGGQTGVDQAALRAAQTCGLDCGGWCPPGRLCESGTIPSIFPLEETPEERSAEAPEIPRSQRTEWNVRDSDGTLVLRPGLCQDMGTDWTIRCAVCYGRPLLVCDPADPMAPALITQWLREKSVHTLNVAGPSESACPGIGEQAYSLLLIVFNHKKHKREHKKHKLSLLCFLCSLLCFLCSTLLRQTVL
jgi:Circularly permutated YpsA SLOG family